ncbi:hypothetical protein [Ruminococcus flavefaciens]|uniref:hypothetical protein n=1 Tax=Ruminococcus flavefaciens TaxID=1265 RepID=UPI0026EA9AD5|nr:hypothetical protein [Ruminococcus flavefaciens]
MKEFSIIKNFPTGNPAAEVAKLALLLVATVVIDSLSDVIKESLEETKSPLGDVIIKEAE